MHRLWLFALVAVAGCGTSSPPPPSRPAADATPSDIEERVHNFCGGSCHPYPPPDRFPREHWRKEVERGFKFFENSAKPLTLPPIEAVVRYYEERSPVELPHAAIPTATKPLDVTFEKLSYPPPAGPKVAISHVNLVKLPAPARPPTANRSPSWHMTWRTGAS
ncbi:MAG TPA: hypothetical protein VMZ71_16135 [Gemmataceae bacterium]|nr:hypothetical protein [Gemmataceae bacterium]